MRKTEQGLRLAPTDLGNFLGCRHRSGLDLGTAEGGPKPPFRHSPVLDDLREKGIEHETAYLEWLVAQGLEVVRAGGQDASVGTGLQATLAHMRSGVDVIYQGTLEDDGWSGRPDFLRKVLTPSSLGNWSYEAYDAKLARETRGGALLQLCVYSESLEAIQGVQPARMHVVTPGRDFAPVSYRVAEYAAYFRLLSAEMRTFLDNRPETYPEPVTHCDYCPWWTGCEERRRNDDHLGYVAGISRRQIESLRAFGVDRLADLAVLDPVPKPSRGSEAALARVRDQARVQLHGREAGQPRHEILEPFDDEHGLALLPVPSPNDIFLDFEGDRFADTGVREYLLGYVMADDKGQVGYTALWAATPEEERKNFQEFIDLAIATRKRDPNAHVYHFAPYEPSALKRLMGRYATREVELDELLRGRAFVDLHRVVKRSLLASVERYSIKDIEPFFGYAREQDLREASESRRVVETAVADGSLGTDDRYCRIVEDYNREDCESTLKLRDWLEGLRAEVIEGGQEIPRPELADGKASDEVSDLDRELQDLRDRLLADVPVDPDARSDEEQARFALAHMMEFHRREDKASWWEYYRLLGVPEDELQDERRAVWDVEFMEVVEQKARIQRYRFPPQELDARVGDLVHRRDETRIGEVVSVDYAAHTIDIKKPKKLLDEHPRGVVLHKHIGSKALREALMDLGKTVLENGFARREPYRAAFDLLLRRPLARGARPTEGEDTVRAASRIALALDGEVLAVQGPPGTGKTYAGGEIICTLIEKGLKVGVTAVSHKVIVNLLESAAERARARGLGLRIVHRQTGKYDGDFGIERIDPYDRIHDELAEGEIDLLGATAWCWTRPDFEQSVDVLVVDEAGQMSLANVLASVRAGRNLILLGDPQQLEQPLQSSHPEGSEVSALYHLLDGEETMPADRGLFLPDTYRLHPAIARFTSEVYYEGKVQPKAGLGLEQQSVVLRRGRESPLAGAGLRCVLVPHTGNQARSSEEVDVIVRIVGDLLGNCAWRDKDGRIARLREEDILVVAPYNAQVSALAAAIPDLAKRIGTVDRFQGQEAPVVIYSMTSSSAEDAPRGMEFLYNRFRFNVATSRARALCILVGSPELFRPECRTPGQMRMANGFCRYKELAEVVNFG
ncbi:MAG: TM0106 family RecB-like putative nuclease [Gammaproteobacteria bacterium]|nr:TM0106 family RecB-like putative nuclease [Gammaproteobacteria bacterium]